MKKLCLTISLVLGLATSGWATMYTGSISSVAGGGMFATQQWADDASLRWNVDDTSNAGYWTYAYSWETEAKDLSHIIIQVSDTFTADNIATGTTSGYEGPKTYTSSDGNSNPFLPEDLFGIKWGGDDTTFTLTIVTDREPMWGDIYAKDGKNKVGSVHYDVYAYNTGFLFDTVAAIANGNAYDATNGRAWVLVPDTESGGGGGGGEPVPEPSTIILLGSGLLGLFYTARRRNKQ